MAWPPRPKANQEIAKSKYRWKSQAKMKTRIKKRSKKLFQKP